jgi:hypothetical protein
LDERRNRRTQGFARPGKVARALIGVHQAAMAMLVGGDWTQARKYFSLSEEYERWQEFTMPRAGSDCTRSSSPRTRHCA